MTATSAPLRKFVKPAIAGAAIPDPAHPGLDLPQDGTDVVWDHYWIGREAAGDIAIVDVATVDSGAPAPSGPSAEPDA